MSDQLVELAAKVVSAYVGRNCVQREDLPDMLRTVHNALSDLRMGAPLAPAVPIEKSIADDYIVCLETGGKYKALTKHLRRLGLTPDAYRRKWDLPADYPMTCRNYSQARARLAREGAARRAREM
ncbi:MULTISPECIES: MucR family transcriptional regulator [unclassified Xanthobacter]|uniref:MucR family transcriptional regulator n=1 Tax=unclassified Xanthobacter TaxID=2623496 RepID=UPI001F31BDAC